MAKVHYDPQGNRLPRVPSAHRRFVARAGTLSKDRQFIAAIGEAQISWNDKYQSFPVALPGPLPANPWEHPANEMAYPPDLRDAEWARHERTRGGEPWADSGHVSHRGAYEWRQLVFRLCADWWPPKYYPCPIGNGGIVHPCTRFVSACLIWHPRYVPKEWVTSHSFGVETLFHDPTEFGSDPDARKWERAFVGLYERIAAQIDATLPIRREMLDDAARNAYLDAGEAERAESLSLEDQVPFRFVRVHPAMTSTDWQGMEPEVLAALGRSRWEPDPMMKHARELSDRGESNKAIARLLGVTSGWVGKRLKDCAGNDGELT